MKRPCHRHCNAPSIGVRAGSLFLALVLGASADTTIQVGSSMLGDNLTSTGQPLDERFTFVVGAFDSGFVPQGWNTGEWLAHWVPVNDVQGQPKQGAFASYDHSLLLDPYPPGTRTNSFAISVVLDHNNVPFVATSRAFVWGFDRTMGGGSGEWILITNPGWFWPGFSSGSVPSTMAFSVTDAGTVAIVGSLDEGGVEMRTAAVTLPAGSASPYETWTASYFSVAELSTPEWEDTLWGFSADADGDGIPNAVEFVTGTNPVQSDSRQEPSVERNGNVLKLGFTRRKDGGNIVVRAEWSLGLDQWETVGVTEVVIEDQGEYERVEARVTVPAGQESLYMRLSAREGDSAG